MKRENRYIVIKREDIDEYLPLEMRDQLAAILDELQHGKSYTTGRELTEYVVVGSDWPMYEQVWQMIENWVDGSEHDTD